MVAVAVVAHGLLGLSWPVAFVLGAIVAPTDAVASVAVAHRLGAPRALIAVVEGESMLNDATGLLAYRVAVPAVVTGAFSLAEAGGAFLVDTVGGVAVGMGVGWVVARVHQRLDAPSIETAITLLTPYAAWLPAESLGVSGVLSVLSAGLYVSRRSSLAFAARLRLQARSVWQTLTFLLEGLLFLLLGLELREVLTTVGTPRSWGSMVGAVVLLGLLVTGVRLLWVFPQAWLPRRFRPALRERDPMPPWQLLVVLGWMGMRGAISLAAVLALPRATASGAPFPEREHLLFLTFGIILWTLLVQGLSLPALMRRLHLQDEGLAQREELLARVVLGEAALGRIQLLQAEEERPSELLLQLQRYHQAKLEQLRAHLQSEGAAAEPLEPRLLPESQQRLLEDVLASQRQALLALRNEGTIHDQVLHRLERELDLEAERLYLASHLGEEDRRLV
jgi:monovalent cation/hydrogen antiporter